MFKYLKFSLFYGLSVLAIIAVLLGNHWIVIGYISATTFMIFGDALFGDDVSTPTYQHPIWLTLQLWFALPLLLLLMLVSLWSIAPTDIANMGSTLGPIFNYDLNLAKANTLWWQHLVAALYVGLMVSMIGTVVGHELVHRNTDKVSLIIGRWLLAMSFDSNFSIEHVYGHHRYVATSKDPATAPRGRNVYQHIVMSTIWGNISAWNIEKSRLNRRKQNRLSLHNTFIRGLLMSLSLMLVSFVLAGWLGLLFFCFVGLSAKSLLEIVNYMEHYGLVRAVNTPVAPRHSWNTNKRMSSWAMFNLSRHSHHHAQGHIPFHQLKPYEDAPTMLNGYLGTICIALIPPLWFKLMAPKLAHWDQTYANEQEKALLRGNA
jgi:alkane 1-monooxygenase